MRFPFSRTTGEKVDRPRERERERERKRGNGKRRVCAERPLQYKANTQAHAQRRQKRNKGKQKAKEESSYGNEKKEARRFTLAIEKPFIFHKRRTSPSPPHRLARALWLVTHRTASVAASTHEQTTERPILTYSLSFRTLVHAGVGYGEREKARERNRCECGGCRWGTEESTGQ